jgi:cbb3-type cytochrome oxidase subunit 3
MIDSFALFVIWLSFTILVICAVIPFVVWAVRSGQFSRFDYAARLPLKSQIVEDTPDDKKPTDTSGKNENVPS